MTLLSVPSRFIEAVGSRTIGFALSTRELVLWLIEVAFRGLASVARFRWRGHETILQMHSIGVQGLPVIAFSLGFLSLMMITEFSYHMKLVLRQDSLVPAFSTVLMIRELGPVVTCLLLASRAGAGIAAEIGTMKLSDQIDALRLLSIDPIEFLVLPRLAASVVMAVSLCIAAIGVAILGGAFIASVRLGYPIEQFFNTMFVFARFPDLIGCVIKAAVFGTVIPLVAAHHGFRCRPGSQGVGDAATAAVVQGSLLIIAADFLLTYLLYAA